VSILYELINDYCNKPYFGYMKEHRDTLGNRLNILELMSIVVDIKAKETL